MKRFSQRSHLVPSIRLWLWQERRIWVTAVAVAGCVLGLRWLGLLQYLELTALDQMFRLRPPESVDQRVVIVSIDEPDINYIQDWPIPDGVMADLLKRIRAYQPRAIGLDIYRELPVGEGSSDLQAVFKTTPNLIGIEKLEDAQSPGVKPPAELQELQQIGFNNVVVDGDNRVRRAVLFWHANGKLHRSLAFQLALTYLKQEGITIQADPRNRNQIKLGHSVFPKLHPNDGGYVRADTGGYQILANPRDRTAPFERISLTDVLQGRVKPEQIRDRIVIIGSTAASLKDFFYNSYSQSIKGSAQPISGVELHANFISQIVSAALDERPLIRVLPIPLEILWTLSWALVGTCLSWRFRHPKRALPFSLLAAASLFGSCYLAFLGSWWIPLVPPFLAMSGSALVITSYIAYLEEELKKSKEFLNSVIHTIPDPIFVKDQNHRWIVLNEAFCRLIGYPLNDLLEKSDADFFPVDEVSSFRRQDDLTFTTGAERESEEEFTNANGKTYLIATKRSLHKDAAGNVFLVGVIRDITQRKRVEEELRRTAAELVQSNAELRQAENRLRHMAYHDSLTSLPNRELFEDRLNQAIRLSAEHNQLVAVLFLDLDGFKGINDTYGHALGDLLLKAVAQRLSRCLRSSDTVARFGGDEFVVLLPAIPSIQDVIRVAEKILHTFANNFTLEGKSITITTSIGISLCPLDAESSDLLLKAADSAMYSAKELGKNQYALTQSSSI